MSKQPLLLPFLQPGLWVVVSLATTFLSPRSIAQIAPVEPVAKGIQDNSFLVEEAYNQEAGVVQHVLNLSRSQNQLQGDDDVEWAAVFTQEWPFFSQTHQLSYTLPYSVLEPGARSNNGLGDLSLNYRWQALMETDRIPAFAPRLSLILPTGDADKDLGDGSVGYQLNLPVSKIVSNRTTLHGNAGATMLPDVGGHDLARSNLGVSAIYALSRNFNVMLEWVGNWDEEIDDAGRRGRSFAAIVSPGVRYAFNHANDAQTVIGIAAPIGMTADAPDYGIFLYVSYEHFFVRPRSILATAGK